MYVWGLGFGFRVSELVPTAELKGRIFDIACKLLKPRARTEGRGDRGTDGRLSGREGGGREREAVGKVLVNRVRRLEECLSIRPVFSRFFFDDVTWLDVSVHSVCMLFNIHGLMRFVSDDLCVGS